MNLRHPQNQNILTEMKSWLIPSPLFSPHPAPSNNCGQMYLSLSLSLSHAHTHTQNLGFQQGPWEPFDYAQTLSAKLLFHSSQWSFIRFKHPWKKTSVAHTHTRSLSHWKAPRYPSSRMCMRRIPVSTSLKKASHGKGEMGQICEFLGDAASGQKNIRRCPETLWKLCTSLTNSQPAVDHVGQCSHWLRWFHP